MIALWLMARGGDTLQDSANSADTGRTVSVEVYTELCLG